MPLSRALFLYGLLLGTGLTTYVPATAAWALPALSLALGDVGRRSRSRSGSRPAGRCRCSCSPSRRRDRRSPSGRAGCGCCGCSLRPRCCVALLAGEVQAAGTVASPGGDPSAAGADLAWQQPGVGGFLRKDGTTTQLPGNDPAIGATFVAWHAGPALTVADRATLTPALTENIAGVQTLAVSRSWLAYRTPTEIHVRPVTATGPGTTVETVKAPASLGRPALGVDLVVFHRATSTGSWITAVNVVSGKRLRLRYSSDAQLLNPSLLAGQLLYVRASRCSQQLGLGPSRRRPRQGPLRARAARRPGRGHEHHHTSQGEHLPCPHKPRVTAKMLWTTALSPTTAYVTVLRPRRGGRTVPTLLAVARR